MVDELAAETVPLNCTFCETNVAGKPTSAAEAAGETVIAPVVVGLIPERVTVVPVNTLLPTVIVEDPVAYEAHVGAVPRFIITPDAETEAIFDQVGAADHRIEVIAVFEPTAAPNMDERGTVRLVEVVGL
jgi:hypothetical protein